MAKLASATTGRQTKVVNLGALHDAKRQRTEKIRDHQKGKNDKWGGNTGQRRVNPAWEYRGDTLG
jgi:hypothetical protein